MSRQELFSSRTVVLYQRDTGTDGTVEVEVCGWRWEGEWDDVDGLTRTLRDLEELIGDAQQARDVVLRRRDDKQRENGTTSERTHEK